MVAADLRPVVDEIEDVVAVEVEVVVAQAPGGGRHQALVPGDGLLREERVGALVEALPQRAPCGIGHDEVASVEKLCAVGLHATGVRAPHHAAVEVP